MSDVSAGWEAFEHEDYDRAERLFRAALRTPALAKREERAARFGLGYALAFSGQYDEARATFDALRQEAAHAGDGGTEHRALHQVGMVERMAGRWREARLVFEQERTLIARLGNDDLAASVNAYELGLVELHLGHAGESRGWFKTSLRHARRAGDQVAAGCAHRGLGDWHDQHGEHEAARHAWEAARAAFEAAGDTQGVRGVERRLAGRGAPG